MNKVKVARMERGLRQIEVVDKSGGILNQYRLSIIERGVKPRPDEAAALSIALGIPAAELFPEQ